MEDLLRSQGYVFAPELFSPWCRKLLKEPRPLGGSLAAAFGLIYIQDRSSMLAPLFLQPQEGELTVDICASPGSKTGFLAQLVGPSGLVLANEPNKRRLGTLRQNMTAMNLAQVSTCRYPGQNLPLPEASLTSILLDPPCSGWGTEERHPRIREIWPEHKLKPLVDLQRALLRQAAKLLVPGGRLLYSTCTTNPAENQDQVYWALETQGLTPVNLPYLSGIFHSCSATETGACLQIEPNTHTGQGFFFAALTKPGQDARTGSPHPGQREIQVQTLDVRAFPGHEFVDWDKLPPGRVAGFNGRAVFLHDKTERFPGVLHWQGFELGRMHGERIRLNTRLRRLLPEYNPDIGLRIEDVQELNALIQGRGLPLPGRYARAAHSHSIGFYWRELPLGWLTVKGTRCLWSPR